MPKRKAIFLYKQFFSVDHSFYLKKQERCFTFKSNLNIKNPNVFVNKKMISYCIIFETNKYIGNLVILQSASLLTVKVIVDKGRPKFL